MTSSHRRSAASERRSGPSRSTAQIATSTRPRLSAAWGVARGAPRSAAAPGAAAWCRPGPARPKPPCPRRGQAESGVGQLGQVEGDDLRFRGERGEAPLPPPKERRHDEEKGGYHGPRRRRNPVRRRSARSAASARSTAGWRRRSGRKARSSGHTSRSVLASI